MNDTKKNEPENPTSRADGVHALSEFIGGWFVGQFSPAIVKTDAFEVAIKYYKKGQTEKRHKHCLAWEITGVVYGCVQMNGLTLDKGSLIQIKPGESADFEALEDSATVVVKSPSVPSDKYFV